MGRRTKKTAEAAQKAQTPAEAAEAPTAPVDGPTTPNEVVQPIEAARGEVTTPDHPAKPAIDALPVASEAPTPQPEVPAPIAPKTSASFLIGATIDGRYKITA